MSINFLYLKIYHILLILFLWPTHSSAGTVIVLNGTSSAGKTSIASALSQQLGQTLKVLSLDKAVLDACKQEVVSRGYTIDPAWSNEELLTRIPQELITTIMSNLDSFIPGAEKLLYEQVRQYAEDSHTTVILDMVINNQDRADKIAQKLHGLTVHTVLVYCTPRVLLEHIKKRNQPQNVIERRDIHVPFYHFFQIYNLQSNRTPACIEEINNKDLHTLITEDIVPLFDSTITPQEIEEHVGKDLPKVDENNLEASVKIAPKSFVNHNLIVNTSTTSPELCAQQIIDALKL